MPNQVDEAVKKQRVHLMQQMEAKSALDFHTRFLGKTLDVLFEQTHEGYTEGLLLIILKSMYKEKFHLVKFVV